MIQSFMQINQQQIGSIEFTKYQSRFVDMNPAIFYY